MTNEQTAIRQWLSKPEPYFSECGCMGPRQKQPLCPCKMQMVEEVNGKWYYIKEHRSIDGITHTSEYIGEVDVEDVNYTEG